MEIAHIRALKQGGPRYTAELSIEERNAFANLILLCTPHHKTVDGPRRENYQVSLLERWKRDREAAGHEALAGLMGMTEEKLVQMIVEANRQLRDQLGPALDEFARTAPELAALLRTVTKQVTDVRRHHFPDEDIAQMLVYAADRLGHLEDSATELREAARMLAPLSDQAEEWHSAARATREAADAMLEAKYAG
ncbi:hypothetical protein [Yinghuangia aomiensis]|uniref:HNH endonuclease signature motif containing protein n=1 Tax=Yinghuangia aomiensis TaxID=676205 RepID=UPI0031F0E381